MGRRHGFGLWAATLVVVGFTAVRAVMAAAGVVTVGDFLRDLANAKRLPATDAVVAEASLRAAGFSLPKLDRSARLTEGAVAAISTAVGVPVTTGDPTAAFDQRRLARYMTAASPQLAASPAGGVDVRTSAAEASGSGAEDGKKKPHSKSPHKPPKPPKPPKT